MEDHINTIHLLILPSSRILLTIRDDWRRRVLVRVLVDKNPERLP
jgi:hypothetical protein